MDGGGAGPFFDEALGLESGEVTGHVTARYFHWEMLMAFGLTESAFRRLPVHEQREMAKWWEFRNERQRQMQERQAMEARAAQGRGAAG